MRAWIATLRERLRAHEPPDEEIRAWPLHAAVVLILREVEGELEALFIKRAEDVRDPWSGHIALPGGRREPTDRSFRETALREAREEVGLDLEREGEILGFLSPLSPSSPHLPPIGVIPLVAVVRSDARAIAGPEVERAFWVPLRTLKERGRSERVEKIVQGNVRTWPAYPSPYGPIWGLTERILTQLLALLE